MADDFTEYCSQAEQVQLNIDEISKYIDELNSFKKSKFNKNEANIAILMLLDSLNEQKKELEAKYQDLYKLILRESDELYTAFNYMY